MHRFRPVKSVFQLLLFVLFLLAITSCRGEGVEETVSLPDGPSLVMVYTDN